MSLDILTLNIGAASIDRAKRILSWLAQRSEPVYILSEMSSGEGSRFILDRLAAANWTVAAALDSRDRGVAVVARVQSAAVQSSFVPTSRPWRWAELKLLTSSGPVRVVGLYVPSRDLSQEKIDGKRGFLEAIESELMNSSFPTIVGGDYNIVSRNHSPKVPQFDFEYSFLEKLEGSGYIDAGLQLAKTPHDHTWFGRTGDRYRYDYFHVRGVDFQAGSQCHYLHETRDSKLSDHSGLSLSLNGAEFLEVEPEAITESDQASLF